MDPPVIDLDPLLIIHSITREKIYCCPVWIHSNWSWFTPDNPLSHQREVSLLPCVDPQIIDLNLLLKSSLSSKGRITTVMCGSPGSWYRSTPDNLFYHQGKDLLLSRVDPPVIELEPPLINSSTIRGKIYCCHVGIVNLFSNHSLRIGT